MLDLLLFLFHFKHNLEVGGYVEKFAGSKDAYVYNERALLDC